MISISKDGVREPGVNKDYTRQLKRHVCVECKKNFENFRTYDNIKDCVCGAKCAFKAREITFSEGRASLLGFM